MFCEGAKHVCNYSKDFFFLVHKIEGTPKECVRAFMRIFIALLGSSK
jgi:hypothetical protein